MTVKLDNETAEALGGTKAKVKEEDIAQAFKLMDKAKALKEQSEEMYSEGQDIMRVIFSLTGLNTVSSNLGKITLGKGRTTKILDQDKMSKYLIERGVSASLVSKSIETSTTSKTSDPVISFRRREKE